jgi:hypothetical protein
MLIAMVIIFGTCWFPINLINFFGDLMNLGTIFSTTVRSFLFYYARQPM